MEKDRIKEFVDATIDKMSYNELVEFAKSELYLKVLNDWDSLLQEYKNWFYNKR